MPTTTMRTARPLALAFALVTTLVAPATALAQRAAWPDRPIRIVAGEPGAQSDAMARMLAPALGASLGQAVVVENRAGAGGTIAAMRVVQSRPDGYTLLLGGANNIVLSPLVRGDLPYRSVRDFVPLGGVARVPYGVAIGKHVDVADLRGFVAYARARPGDLAFGSSGVGSSSHAALALLAARAGLSMLHVPYRGSPVALNEVLGGRIEAVACDLSLILPYAKSGAVRLVAVAGAERAAAAPALPTVAEQGFPGYAVDPWYALYAPAGTPQEAIDALTRALADAMRAPGIRQQLAAQGWEPLALNADEMRALAHADTLRFEGVLEEVSGRKEDQGRPAKP